MDRIYTESVRLDRLRTRIESGIFAVPELQREFVWNARKACDLLDSICRNFPIGTILVWKTSRRNEGQLRKQLHILPPFDAKNRDIYFLIDGQQRLSVLWHLLRGQPATVTNADGKVIDFGCIYFNPYAKDGDRLFVYRNRLVGDQVSELVPVVHLLSSGWRRRVGSHGVRAIKRLDETRTAIHRYVALMVFCETNDLTEVRETFIRINSLGMRIGTADRAFARASKFHMRGLVRDAQARLKHGFNRVRRTTVLQTVALVLGGRDVAERAIDSMISSLESDPRQQNRFNKEWPKLRDAFGRAVDFLVYELNVPNFDFIPSEPMMVILAIFFYHNGPVRPSRAAQAALRRWFWSTAVGARYTGRGYRPNILADAKAMEQLARNSKAKFSPNVLVPLHDLRRVDYSRPGPVSNAFFCLLRLNRPRFLEDATKIPPGEISSRRNRSDKHHIFPRALLTRHGISAAQYNCILNICYLVARENQSVGQRAPSSYLDDVPRNGRVRNLAMRSHFIPSTTGRGVWGPSVKRGFRAFLDQRARLLARAFEKQAGVRLFERG